MTRIKYAKRGRKRRHGDDKTEYCQAVLAAAKKNTKLKFGLNTRLTHKAVFDYYHKELAAHGVAEVSEFTRIIRAHQAREQRVRDKELEAHKPPPLIRRNLVYYMPSVREAESPRKTQGKRHGTKA